jgi:hypothetical protein
VLLGYWPEPATRKIKSGHLEKHVAVVTALMWVSPDWPTFMNTSTKIPSPRRGAGRSIRGNSSGRARQLRRPTASREL